MTRPSLLSKVGVQVAADLQDQSPSSVVHRRSSVLSWTRLDWAVLIGLGLLVLLFHWRLLTPNPADRQSYGSGDFVYQFWAFSTFEARELSAGRLPLWNPYAYAGSPFWADVQSAAFYPFSLLTLFLSGLTSQGFSLFALELEAIFHFWLAGLFMYLFARRVSQSRGGGWVAALVFTFGGYLTGYPSQQLAVLEVDVWLPLILFFVDRALIDRRPDQPPVGLAQPRLSDLLPAGGAWGIALLAGHPQSWLIVGYTLVAYYLFLAIWGYERSHTTQGETRNITKYPGGTKYEIRKGYGLLIILVIGLALSAIQLFPAIEYTWLSVRADGTYNAMSGGLPLIDPIQLLLPGIVSYYSPLYVGVIGLLLVVLALFYGRNRFTTFWGIWSGVSFLITFGGETFLYSPLYLAAPGFSIFRGQERWAFAFALGLALLAGYGFAILMDFNRNRQTSYRRVTCQLDSFRGLIGWLLIGAIGLIILFFFGLNQTGWSSTSQFYKLLNGAVLLTILLALSIVVFRVAIRITTKPTLILTALTGLIVFDLFSVNWRSNLDNHLPEWPTRQPELVTALIADAAEVTEPFRVYNEFRLYDNYGIPFALQDLWGASPLRLSRYDHFMKPPMLIERAWWLLNARYVITWRNELYTPSTILNQEPAPDGTTYLHRLTEVGPRAWVVHQVEQMPEAAMIDRLATPDFDFRRVALLPPNVPLPALEPSETDRVMITAFEPNRLSLSVEAGAAGLLMVSEVDYPGWRLTINGHPAPTVRANGLLRAVPVAAGRHNIVFTFVPTTFWVGGAVSGVTLLFLLAYAGWRIFLVGKRGDAEIAAR